MNFLPLTLKSQNLWLDRMSVSLIGAHMHVQYVALFHYWHELDFVWLNTFKLLRGIFWCVIPKTAGYNYLNLHILWNIFRRCKQLRVNKCMKICAQATFARQLIELNIQVFGVFFGSCIMQFYLYINLYGLQNLCFKLWQHVLWICAIVFPSPSYTDNTTNWVLGTAYYCVKMLFFIFVYGTIFHSFLYL
jgi:hypothetical protein